MNRRHVEGQKCTKCAIVMFAQFHHKQAHTFLFMNHVVLQKKNILFENIAFAILVLYFFTPEMVALSPCVQPNKATNLIIKSGMIIGCETL